MGGSGPPAFARQFGVGPADVDRNDVMRSHHTVGLFEGNSGDGAGQCGGGNDARQGARLRLDDRAIANGAFSNEHDRSIPRKLPAFEHAVWGARHRRHQLASGRVVQDAEDLPALSIHPCRHQFVRRRCAERPGQRFERWHGDDTDTSRHGKALHGGDADTEAGERSGTRGNREKIHVLEAEAGGVEHSPEVAWEALTVRERGIAESLDENASVAGNGHASRAGRGVKSEDVQRAQCYTRAVRTGRPAGTS